MKFVEQRTNPSPLTIANPALPGSLEIREAAYGSGGGNLFSNSSFITTKPVDAPSYLDDVYEYRSEPSGENKKFPVNDLPIQGKVWYPDSAGKHPLILIVHGNSDPGFEYIGELLASRCCIVASVNETFLNVNLSRESGVRGWLLLEHLRVWDKWNQLEGNLFHDKVDMENIALIGMSRGGEAVAIATALNQATMVPNESSTELNYDYSIKAVAALAPHDGQYPLFGSPTDFNDVSYLIIHGGHDADMWQFLGSRQWQRIDFSPSDSYRFKSSLYAYRANHINFNQSMSGAATSKERRLFSLPLMTVTEQEDLTKVYLSAFIESTLLGNLDYLPIFKDSGFAANWIATDIYVNRFLDSKTTLIANFEEDSDLQTTQQDGIRLVAEGNSLVSWNESAQLIRGRLASDNKVLRLEWENCEEIKTPDARLIVRFESQKSETFELDRNSNLIFSLGPHNTPRYERASNCTEKSTNLNIENQMSLSVRLIDANGESSSIQFSDYASIPPLLTSDYSALNNTNWTYPQAEPKLNPFELSLSDFLDGNSEFDLKGITEIRFEFQNSEGDGVILMDDIGFSK